MYEFYDEDLGYFRNSTPGSYSFQSDEARLYYHWQGNKDLQNAVGVFVMLIQLLFASCLSFCLMIGAAVFGCLGCCVWLTASPPAPTPSLNPGSVQLQAQYQQPQQLHMQQFGQPQGGQPHFQQPQGGQPQFQQLQGGQPQYGQLQQPQYGQLQQPQDGQPQFQQPQEVQPQGGQPQFQQPQFQFQQPQYQQPHFQQGSGFEDASGGFLLCDIMFVD